MKSQQELRNESEQVTFQLREQTDTTKVHVCPICEEISTVEFLHAPDRFHGRANKFELRRCPACSMVWISNPPSSDQMAFHYGVQYHKAITNASESSPKRWQNHC